MGFRNRQGFGVDFSRKIINSVVELTLYSLYYSSMPYRGVGKPLLFIMHANRRIK